MEPWPFDTITPEQFDDLADEEKEGLESAVIAYLADVEQKRRADPATMGKTES